MKLKELSGAKNRHFRQGWERISRRRGPQAGSDNGTGAKESRLEICRKPTIHM
jgi:hypothetical protein